MIATKPQKELVRQYMLERQKQASPPPRIEEIRRQLGWELVQKENRNGNNQARYYAELDFDLTGFIIYGCIFAIAGLLHVAIYFWSKCS